MTPLLSLGALKGVAIEPPLDAKAAQAKRVFSSRVTLITAGRPAALPNLDTVPHHAGSFAPNHTCRLTRHAGMPDGIAVPGRNLPDASGADGADPRSHLGLGKAP